MKAYLIVTAAIFGLVGIAHLFRLLFEGHPLSDPEYLGENVALFLVCGGLAIWALLLLKRRREPSV
jgi:hypothetical protein